MASKISQVYVCCTIYHVYISILKAFEHKKNGEETLLIVLKDGLDDHESVEKSISDIDVFTNVIFINGYKVVDKLKSKLGYFNYIFNRSKSLVELYEGSNENLIAFDCFIQKSEINLFQINRAKAFFLIKYKNNFFRMYEDGVGAYSQTLSFSRYFTRKYILRTPLLKGYDSEVKEIWVRFPEKMNDKILSKKVKKFNLVDSENSLSDIEKKKIVYSFIGKMSIKNSDSKRAIIITQPLSEFKITTLENKIKVYSYIIDICRKEGYDIFIKNHPKDELVYTDFYADVNVLPKQFPLEVLNLSKDFNFHYGYTVFSTALENLKYVENKVFLGKEFLENI